MLAKPIGCLALLLVALVALCSALEEHPHFCIETEPLLLSEIDRHVVIPSEKDLQCHIKATTLTLKEKVNHRETHIGTQFYIILCLFMFYKLRLLS